MTIILIVFTSIISILAFRNQELFAKLQFNPYQVYHRKEYYRLITHGFLHAGWWHLIINMMVLYFFGRVAEKYMEQILGYHSFPVYRLVYVGFYLLAIVVSSLISLLKHRNNIWYNAVGASGAVSAVTFFFIFFNPWEPLYLYGIVKIPGIIFGVLYLIYSQVMRKRNVDNINHDAHFVGAVFGFIFPLFINVSLINHFLNQLLGIF